MMMMNYNDVSVSVSFYLTLIEPNNSTLLGWMYLITNYDRINKTILSFLFPLFCTSISEMYIVTGALPDYVSANLDIYDNYIGGTTV